MESIRQRNQQILQMRQVGISRSEVADKFRVSVSLIAAIEKRNRAESLMMKQRAKIRDELRQADDPERMWATPDLIDALNLSVLFRRRLLDHFEKIGKTEMSLREFMRLAAYPPEDSGTGLPPMLEIDGVWTTGLRRVIKEISKLEFGERCSLEWHKVLLALIRARML